MEAVGLFPLEEATMDDATARALQDELDRLDLERACDVLDDDMAVAFVLRTIATPTAEQLTEAGRHTAELRKRLETDLAEQRRIHELGESLNIDDKE